MSAFLPQNDRCSVRKIQLGIARRRYKWNHSYLNPLALVDHVPVTDLPTLEWTRSVLDRAVNIFSNRLAITGDEAAARAVTHAGEEVHRRLSQGVSIIEETAEVISIGMDALSDVADETHRPNGIDDYASLFNELALPPIHKDFRDDAVFTDMRVAGPNPVMLQRVTSVPDHFGVTNEQFAATMQGDSLDAAGQEGRLYLADYRQLDGQQAGSIPRSTGADEQKFVYAPLALFALDKTSRELRPVAIQCKQTPSDDNPVFTPQDGHNWLIAKTTVEIADGCVHEPVTHLGRTHLYMEPFCIAMHRQLARRHPLFKLLAPHFEGTLFINNQAQEKLVAPGGPVDLLMSPRIGDSLKAAAAGHQAYLFNEELLPVALQNREVADSEDLPNYPYRDDALLYWNAIHKWTSDYIGIYYKTESDVVGDPELQKFIGEVRSRSGGCINGLDMVNSREYLADVLTMIIFTASVQHAAVNFPQWNYMSYVPNISLGGYAPPPTSTSGATEQDFLNMLPPMDMARLEMEVGYLLGTVHYTQLGQYHEGHFAPEVADILKSFQSRIQDIGREVEERNKNRRPYKFLLPSGIPQSINI